MSRSQRKKTYKTRMNKRPKDCIAGLECMKPCGRKRIPYRKAMECLNAFAERIKRLEQDNSVLNEALKAFILKDTFSMHELGARYVTGECGDGEQADFDLGIWFYKRGAMLGDIECQWDYAMMLYSGEHMPQDNRKALFWFRKAAENPVDQYGRGKDALEMCEIIRQELAEQESDSSPTT